MLTTRSHPTIVRIIAASTAAALLATCTEHAPTQPEGPNPIELQVVITSAALPATAPVGTTLPPLQVKVLNKKNGQTLYNEPVSFVVVSGGGSVFAPSVQTDNASGIALDLWTLGTRVGFDTLQARVVDTSRVGPLAGSASIVTFAVQATPLAASLISAQGGNGQTAVAGTALLTSPSVLVTDRFGNPITGVSVTFAAASGGGSVTGPTQPTNASGTATVGSWTLGATAGPNTLTATSIGLSGSPVTFSATGINAAANQIIPATTTVFSGPVGSTIPAATGPAVRVVDSHNNGVPNVPITFTVTSPACPSCGPYPGTTAAAGAKIAGVGTVTVLTDATGRASGGAWTLSTLAGADTLLATAVSLAGSPIVFTATGTPGSAALVFKQGGDGQSAAVGTAVATAPSVQVTDVYGNPSPSGVSVSFAVQSGGGSATPSSIATDLNGIASTSWTLGAVAGSNTLTASTLSKTLTFSATGTGPAGLYISNFAGDGQSGAPGSTLPIAPAALVTDQNGHPVAGVSVTFSVTAGGGSITGPSQLTNANGIATVGSWTLGAALGVNELQAAFNTGVSNGYTIFVAIGSSGNTWITRAPMPTGRCGLGMAALNGILYAVGGYNGASGCGATNSSYLATLEAYNPVSNSWTSKASMPTARYGLAVASLNGNLYAVGGYNGSYLTTVEAYDPSTNTWSAKAPMPTGRFGLGVASIGGILYAVGGDHGPGGLTTVEAYDPSSNTWSTKSSMPTGLEVPGVTVVNGILYAVGGYCNGDPVHCQLATVEAYDPVTDTWTLPAPMPTARAYVGAAGIGGRLYAAGGAGAGGALLGTLEIYDPSSNTWSIGASLPTPRGWFGAGALNGLLYTAGGGIGTTYAQTVEAYQP